MSRQRRPPRRMLLRLAQLSPTIGFLAVALVWFSVPSSVAPDLATLNATTGPSSAPQARADWVSRADDASISEAFGLSDGPASLSLAAEKSWTNWVDSLGAHPTTAAVLAPRIASADATTFAPIRQWERTHNARVWAWVTPAPTPAAVVASATGDPDSLARTMAQFEEDRQSAAADGDTLPRDEISWLWALDAGRGDVSNKPLPPLATGFTVLGDGGGASGGSGYDLTGVNLRNGGRLWRALVVAPQPSPELPEPAPSIDDLSALDPLKSHFADDVGRFARKAKVNVWVLGPLSMPSIPLRLPDKATAEQAAALGPAVWPSTAISTFGKPGVLRPLTGETARLAGGQTAFMQVTGLDNTAYWSDGGSTVTGPRDILPQTVAFLAVFDRAPLAPSPVRAAWTAWQRFVSSWFPFLLGGAVGLLALTLVLSPAAFVRERRVIARQRVREDMARMRRDAHDKVYNRLSALSKRVATSGDELAASNAAALTIIAEDIRATVGELQEILGEEVRHTDGVLASVPLAEQLRGVCAAQAARLGVEVSCEPSADLPEVDPLLGWDLQCVAEEAITNAVRHGGAAHLRVRASATDGAIELTVTDDGSGSDVLRPDDAPVQSTGLRGMHDRLERHGGGLSLARGKDGGTTLSARVPLAREGRGA